MMMLQLGTSKIYYLYLTDIIYIISTYFKSKIKSTSFSFSMQMAALTVDFRKHSGTNTADDMAAQIITDCRNFTLDFKQHGLCVSPLFLQTVGP